MAFVACVPWSCDGRPPPSGLLGADGDSCLGFEDCISEACFDGICGVPRGEASDDCTPAGGACGGCCEGLICRDGFCRSPAVTDTHPGSTPVGGGEEGAGEGEGEGEGVSDPFLEENTEADCKDGRDNDDDGQADCVDEGCLNTTECRLGGGIRESRSAPPGSCTDGIDNDGDGDVDCEDEPCRNTRECLE